MSDEANPSPLTAQAPNYPRKGAAKAVSGPKVNLMGHPRPSGPRGQKGALEAFDLRHQKIRVCIEKFEEFDARTGVG